LVGRVLDRALFDAGVGEEIAMASRKHAINDLAVAQPLQSVQRVGGEISLLVLDEQVLVAGDLL